MNSSVQLDRGQVRWALVIPQSWLLLLFAYLFFHIFIGFIFVYGVRKCSSFIILQVVGQISLQVLAVAHRVCVVVSRIFHLVCRLLSSCGI